MNIHRLDSIRKLFLLPFAHLLRLSGILRHRKKSGRAIAVFYTGKLGDMVCLTPVLEALKENNKDAKLIVFARSKFLAIWKDNPFIDEKIGFINERNAGSLRWLLRQWRLLNKFESVAYFNLVNNFEGGILGLTFKTAHRYLVTTRLDGRLNRLLYPYYSVKDYKFDRSIKEFYFELLGDAGMKVGNTVNKIYFAGKSAEAEEFFRANSSAGRVVIGSIVSSGKDYKVWPKEYWIELLKKIRAEYQPVILLFGLKEDEADLELIKREVGGDIHLLLGKGLDVLPYYLKKCQLFVSVDTGLLYIADALTVPVVDILGPCDDNNQRPENNYRLVTDRAVCRPQCKMLFNAGIDVAEVKSCFFAITPAQVFAACREFLPH
ncbi:MAG: glycosyltransferase family 9 protein [Candidatus Buchananbacteria bacterium]|jgi:ADP-heptose:LPS heptosyltransferase